MSGISLFDRQKKSVLDQADLSRKGSVDQPIEEFMRKLNQHDDLCRY